MLMCIIFNDLICTETFVTFLTVHQRITESSQMSGSDPCLRIHQDRTVNTYVVRVLLYKFLPPCSLYVVLKFNTQVTIIPCICKPTVDFRPRIYKAS